MYDTNPTLEGIKTIDEAKQGQILFKEHWQESTFPGGKNFISKVTAVK
jgi:hypothetical protein